jgi:hypothetical protein
MSNFISYPLSTRLRGERVSPSLPKTPFLINICSLTPISQSYLIDFIYARCQNDIVVLENIF